MKAAAGILLCLSTFVAGQDFQKSQEKVRIQSSSVSEASGLAVSPTNPEFLWLINDSGSPALLHLCDTMGKERGIVSIKGARNIDWEDISSFTLDGKNYLLIADTGDNGSKRKSCTLYVLEEPSLP